ncbi:MAG: tetratricopeptide repeat protein [Thermodesulfovibrionales bacterium]
MPYKTKAARILDILLIAGFFCLVFVLSLRRLSDYDLWGHLKAGEYFFKTGTILSTHYFNCSWPEFPYLNHEWLFQAISYGLYNSGGEALLVALQIFLVLSSFILLYKTVRLYSGNIRVIVFVLALGVLASSHRFVLRPQHFSYVFLLINLYCLHQYTKGRTGYLYLLPPVMLLWVNIHAESLWGIAVPAIFLVTEAAGVYYRHEKNTNLKKLFFVFILVVLAALINPFTYKTVIWPFLVMSEQFAGVEELLPPTTLKYLPFWIYFGIFIFSAFFSIRRIKIHFLLISIFFSAIAWSANRGIPHFIFASAPVVVAGISRMLESFNNVIPACPGSFWRKDSRFSSANPPECGQARMTNYVFLLVNFLVNTFRIFIRTALLISILYLIFSVITSPKYFRKFDSVPYPEGAVTFIKDKGIKGNMFNLHGWGGYIVWELYPPVKPYIDNRFFHRKFFAEYEKILSGEMEWQYLLNKYKINIVLLNYSPTNDINLRDHLFRSSEWRLVYWDDYSLLYLRNEAGFSAINDRYAMHVVNPDTNRFSPDERDKAGMLPAFEDVRKNIENAEDSWLARFILGSMQYSSGDMQGSARSFEDALRLSLDPVPEIYFNLGQAYMATGRLSEAEKTLKKVIELVPDVQAYQALRRVYLMQGKNKEAETILNRHLERR